MNHVDRNDFLQIATGKINDHDRFIAESVSSIRFEVGVDGKIVLFATVYGESEAVPNLHAIHEFDADAPLVAVLEVLASSSNAVLRQLATTTVRPE